MAGERYALFLSAKQQIRRHPDWSDEQIAEAMGSRLLVVATIIAEARRDNAADVTEHRDQRGSTTR